MSKWLAAALAVSLLSFGAAAEDLRDFGRGSWQELRVAHDNRPTVVHFWGLTCGPCLAELPGWGRFARAAVGTDIVLIAADPVPEPAADLLRVLHKAGLDQIENWRFADRFTERLRHEIEPDWRGELPMTMLLDRDGSVRTQLGDTDFAALRGWIAGQNQPGK